MTERREPYLLTPGPLTTSATTKEAMLRDWGSRDAAFIAMNARVRDRLVDLAGGRGSHVCVPLQGSGTFIVEAMIGTLVPPAGKLLVLVNGAYGRRMVRICEVARRAVAALEAAEDAPVDPAALDAALAADPAITHVAVVQCETTSGVLNPVEAVAEVTARRGRRLLVDAMSAFGALPLDAARVRYDALVASSNKCLEGVPGVGFAIVRQTALEAAAGQAPSLSLDLHDQWAVDGEDAAVALHPAHPRRRRARPGAGRARGRGRRGRPRARATARAAGSSSPGSARSASRPCCPTRSRRRSSSPCACPPTRASSSTSSTGSWPRAAS